MVFAQDDDDNPPYDKPSRNTSSGCGGHGGCPHHSKFHIVEILFLLDNKSSLKREWKMDDLMHQCLFCFIIMHLPNQ